MNTSDDPLGVAVRALGRVSQPHVGNHIYDADCDACHVDRIAKEALALISAPPAAVGDSAERAVNAAESKRLLALAENKTPRLSWYGTVIDMAAHIRKLEAELTRGATDE